MLAMPDEAEARGAGEEAMTDAEKCNLPPAMQDAVKFVELWQLARTTEEFIDAMGMPKNAKTVQWSSARAIFFRKHGVDLIHRKKGKAGPPLPDYDFLTLQVIAKRSLASIAGKTAEAQCLIDDFQKARLEASHILAELRKYKGAVLDRELKNRGSNA